MRVTIVTDNGTSVTYSNLPLLAEHAVMAALIDVTKDKRVSAIGACLCTSFRRDTTTDKCADCRHASHSTRVYCGGL